jgi:hydantoinase/carbamoylase family amidase
LELHIEQGGVLDNTKTPIGVVNGIVGITRYRATVNGIANHAGSTPMNLRDDALVKTCKMIIRLMEIAHLKDEEITCTVGQMTVLPGAVNVIPGKVEFIIELRGKSIALNEEIIEQFYEEFKNQGLILENILNQKETVLDERIISIIEDCCKEMNIIYRRMYSGAGHDAINMALFTPSAMIFIPSIDGISHSIVEKSLPKDIAVGCQVLLNSIVKLDK